MWNEHQPLQSSLNLFNDSFTVGDWLQTVLVVGSTYFIGPDVLSRSMAAKNGKTAARVSLSAALILLIFNLLMVYIILWCRDYLPCEAGINPLLTLINKVLPYGIDILLLIALIAALLSSASTCLISAAGLITNDILKKPSVKILRCSIAFIGFISAVLAFYFKDIISLLTASYCVYGPGLVLPIFVALKAHSRYIIRESYWIIAVLCGGSCGLLATLCDNQLLTILGMALSLFFALIALKPQKIEKKR